MVPRILLADADAFFVAVARLNDPQGAGQAPLLLVGGSPQERGVVCSASYEARRFGVRSAMPMSVAVRLCPQAMVVPVPRRACSEKSRAIREVLACHAPLVEAASIDEWYLDLTGTERLYEGEPLVRTAHRIRAAVYAETGLWVSVGGGTNKLVAKLAVELAKKPPPGGERGAHIVAPGAEAAFMTRFQLGEIPGVGPRLQQRLAEFGLRSVSDALPYDEAALRGMLGERVGRWLLGRVRGQCPDPVVAHRECKSIGREETFAVDLHDEAALGLRLRGLLQQAAADLRRAGFYARTLTVKIKDADFIARQRSRTLATPVQSERVLTAVGLDLLAELRTVRSVGARLLGVALSSLSSSADSAAGPPGPPRGQQLSLFAEADPAPAPVAPEPIMESERDRQVTRVFDAVRAKFGDAALLPGWEAPPTPPSR
ncbi:MAG TPA: DNA polymerase IV [Pseudomonadota bacterium]|nr:DNA polymerase IV [Pseudomonadota bacterium]